MEIKIVIVVALVCSLISVSSGFTYPGIDETTNPGKASYNSNFPASQKCPSIDITTINDFYVAVNPQATEYKCGAKLEIRCVDKPYCSDAAKVIAAIIVDKCIPLFCPGKYDMILSKEAFDTLATTKEPVIEVDSHVQVL